MATPTRMEHGPLLSSTKSGFGTPLNSTTTISCRERGNYIYADKQRRKNLTSSHSEPSSSESGSESIAHANYKPAWWATFRRRVRTSTIARVRKTPSYFFSSYMTLCPMWCRWYRAFLKLAPKYLSVLYVIPNRSETYNSALRLYNNIHIQNTNKALNFKGAPFLHYAILCQGPFIFRSEFNIGNRRLPTTTSTGDVILRSLHVVRTHELRLRARGGSPCRTVPSSRSGTAAGCVLTT